jgi:hypothetical protein
MSRRFRMAAALLAVAALPLASALANPAPGTVFVGAPANFGADQMHLQVAANGKTMTLVGSFAWSYGCREISNYGVADPQTFRRLKNSSITMFYAPTLTITGSTFSGTEELWRYGHRYGRFTITGRFTGARSASASFSMANPPRCGTFSERFTLRSPPQRA